ncbi:MAG: hypothetical protein F2813_02565 [Actinobacteria bacterium]|uniref:Unannotated protein n=1 Tax=freshwater metagenome TaxID=449393 RepID=A0A6J5ZHG7_9ZZZZ|nr:hypothetical protein [Actinomycetota bacterium]
MKTLVISDTHIGSRRPVDILRRPEPLAALCEALGEVDRLVLLGDLLELRHGPLRDALAAAKPILEAIGKALPRDAEVVIVSGNHDSELVAPWLARRGALQTPPPLGTETRTGSDASPATEAIAAWLGDRVRCSVAYPGLWLRDDVWATHGHYLDRLITIPTFERIAAGGMARVVGRLPEEPGGATAEDFEAALSPVYAWLNQIANGRAAGGRWVTGAATAKAWTLLSGDGRAPLRGKALAALLPLGIAGINLAGLGPVSPKLSSDDLRRAGLEAMRGVVSLLDIDARWVIFGHTHCAGPLPWMDPFEWRLPGGGQLLNTGCWTDEPRINSTDLVSPYRPGRGILIGESGPPEQLVIAQDVGRRPSDGFE